jgi:benzoyl-CoA 2,3-dioxygenase component A
MSDLAETTVINQHLIDPEICIRCNTCEATCPIGAITHNDLNYVVDASKCNSCMDCISPCPTGSIDNWRQVLREQAYSVDDQLTWDELPEQGELAAPDVTAPSPNPSGGGSVGATIAPKSAAQPQTLLFGPSAAMPYARATVVGNHRVTDVGHDYDTHHIVLDFGETHFPVLEGQSLGILAPGVDATGRPHHARQYSIASPRHGERPGYNNLSITVKRVLEDHAGNPVRGVASNYLCDAAVGDTVQVVGPFGSSFLMPNHANSHLVMICTGTGSAPMRGMTEWRRRLLHAGTYEGGELHLFFGARSKAELPYFGPLKKLPSEFITTHLALSREPDQPKQYVQDVMRTRAPELARLMADPHAYFYVCGLKAMEEGVLAAMADICAAHQLDWAQVAGDMKRDARLHLETY